MFCDHFNFSKNFEFKTNSILDIYKFRSVKSYMMKNLFKTDEALTSLNPQSSSFGRGEKEAYEIMRKKKREYNKIVKSYNNDIKKYICEVKDSFYNSYYNNEEKIRYNNIKNLLNRFYEKLEKIIDFIFGNREKLQKFSNNLFCELLKLNSILSVSLGSQINSVGSIDFLNFHELAPSTMYIFIYIMISKLYDIDIRKLGFNPDDVEDKAFICITSEKLINVVPVLDFVNEIYYKINENSIKSNSGFSYASERCLGNGSYASERCLGNGSYASERCLGNGKDEIDLSIDEVKNIFKKVMFNNRDAETFVSGKRVKYNSPIKNINYFCCNSLFDSNPLKYEFGFKEKLFYV